MKLFGTSVSSMFVSIPDVSTVCRSIICGSIIESVDVIQTTFESVDSVDSFPFSIHGTWGLYLG